MRCQIEGCGNDAQYLVNNRGYKQGLCIPHLKQLHTPENDPEVIVMGVINTDPCDACDYNYDIDCKGKGCRICKRWNP